MVKRQYELIYILPPDTSEDQAGELHTQVEAIVSRLSGQIEKTENWGRRKLAYDIGPHKEGTYVVETLLGGGDLIKEIDRRLKVSDLVIRHLIVRVDEAQQVIERGRAKRTETSRRRRVARGLPPDRLPGEGQRGEGDEDRDDRFDVEVER